MVWGKLLMIPFADTGVSKRDMIRLSHSMRLLDFTSELKKVSCPVAIVCGEKDNANQKAARQLGRDDFTAELLT